MKLILYYFSIPFWRAEVTRISLFINKVEFIDYRISDNDYKKFKKNGELPNGMIAPFRQLPVLYVDGKISVEEDAQSIKERKNISNNGFMNVTIIINQKGNIQNKPILNFKGLPILQKNEFLYGLEEEIENTTKTFSLNNKKQEVNIIDAIKTTCRKYSKEKTGKRPIMNINLVRL